MVALSYLLGTITFNIIYFGITELVSGIPIWLVISGSAFSISLSVWRFHKARVLQKDVRMSKSITNKERKEIFCAILGKCPI